MQAAREITRQIADLVTGIQFEDGSGHKFNYHTSDGKWQFIDLGHQWVLARQAERDELNSAISTNDSTKFLDALPKVVATFSKRMGDCVKAANELSSLKAFDELFQ